MNFSLKKFWNDNGIGGILIALVFAYIIYMFFNNLSSKGSVGSELMSQERPRAYGNGTSEGNPAPSEDIATSGNELYSSINDPTSLSGLPNCNQNPADLLPSDTNSQWAELNPSGKGELSNINLLKAGAMIGIDTIGQSLRNANLQLRSDPQIPQVPTGPWNQSTITGDNMRVPFEIGVGG
jgi:hypothetical protein